MNMRSSSPKTGYSASVEISLQLGDEVLSVAQMGPGFIILSTPCDRQSSTGIVRLVVDGRASEWPVSLPEGIAANTPRVRLESAIA